MAAQEISGIVFERASAVLLARVRSHTGQYVTQASLSQIRREIWEIVDGSPSNVSGPTAQTIADVIFDTLQTGDPRWTFDAIGYNFLATIGKDDLPNKGEFKIEYECLPVTAGERFWVKFSADAQEILFAGP